MNVIRNRPAKLCFVLLSICCLWCPLNAISADDADNVRPDVLLGNSYVIKATVQKLWVANQRQFATLQIDEVLHGPKTLKSISVTMPVFTKGGHGVLILDPELQVKEEGVWLVKMQEGRVVVDVYPMQKWQFLKMPSRKEVSKIDFEEAEKWGRNVGAANKLDHASKLKLLEQFSKDTNNITAAWAKLSLERLLK